MTEVLQFWRGLPPEVTNNILRLLLAILVLLLVWLMRRVLAWAIVAPVRRLTKGTRYEWVSLLLDTLTPTVRLLVIVAGIVIGAQILEVDFETVQFLRHLIRSLVVLAVFIGLYRFVDMIAPTSARLFRLTGLDIPERLLPFIRTAAKLALVVLGIVVIIQEWGYDVSGIIAGAGLAGLAFSLAAQDTVANLFGFTTIVGDQPFVVGEFIKTPDVEGVVEHVGVRSTRIRQLNQAYVTIPNSKLAQSVILNWSRLSKRWLDLTLPISYQATGDQITAIIERVRAMLLERELVQADSVLVNFVDFGENGLRLLIRCYINLADWGQYTAEKERIYLEIMKIIEHAGLSIAFSARTVYIENAPFAVAQTTHPHTPREDKQ